MFKDKFSVVAIKARLVKRVSETLKPLLVVIHLQEEEDSQVKVHQEVEGVEVEVADEGIGIDEKDMPQLFTPFFRSDRSRARKTGGVGLGLALARRIVVAHGGSLSLESQPGQGTTARVTLPAAPPA